MLAPTFPAAGRATVARGRANFLLRAALTPLVALLVACGESAPAPRAPTVSPIASGEPLGTFDMQIDDQGHVTTRPVELVGGGSSEIRRQVYGTKNVDVVLPTKLDSIKPNGGANRIWYISTGVKNLLSFPIGDEQGALSPADTQGIFMFLVAPPAISAPAVCGGCAVAVINQRGTGSFGGANPNKQYFYFHSRLRQTGAAGGLDSTLRRVQMRFNASNAITGFNFKVLLSAAWPLALGDSSSVTYRSDSTPTSAGAEPPWKRVVTNQGTIQYAASGGSLLLQPTNNHTILFQRLDSISNRGRAFITANIRTTNGSSSTAETEISVLDGSRAVTLGLSRTKVGFVTSSGAFVGTTLTFNTTGAFHTYSIHKYGSTEGDTSVFYVDAVRRFKVANSVFSSAGGVRAFRFGEHSRSNNGVSARWTSLTYRMGAAVAAP